MNTNTIGQLLYRDRRVVSVSESHGILSGVLCADPQNGILYLTHSFTQPAVAEVLPKPYIQLLHQLSQATEQQLNHPDFGFQMALAEDEAPLEQRCLSLAEWCQGFLLGINLYGEDSRYRGEVREALQDIAQISSQLFSLETIDSQSEADWVEIVEYVRVAVLVVHTENKHKPGQFSYTSRQMN